LDSTSKTVLVTGVYLSEQKNNIENLVGHFHASGSWEVIQKWIAIGENGHSREVKKFTVMNLHKSKPKYAVLNELLTGENLNNYQFVIICDDDILLPPRFIDDYLDLVVKYDFALAQPSRTHNSYIDHPFVQRFEGLKARRTCFVEIGPLISIRRDAFSFMLPFDESSFMGWGYDFVWPCLIEKAGLRMGIIDATPVDHSMRKPVKNYNYDTADRSMSEYLSRNRHLSKDEAFRILESYA
jgi:hypothetical protein